MELRRYPELDGKTFLVCIGAMKTGTSWLYKHLSKTSGVVVSPLKEVQFFNARYTRNALFDADLLAMRRLAFHLAQKGDRADNLRDRPAFQASIDRAQMVYDDNAYFGHFARLVEPETSVFADLTPAYAAIEGDGFRFMRRLCDSQAITTKVLFVLRDPVERLWSHLHLLRQFKPDRDPVENWHEVIRDPTTLARCDYKGTLEAVEGAFDRDHVITLFYEDLFESGFARLCADLNLTPPAIEAGTRENATDGKADLPDEVASSMRSLLDEQYAYCRNRFGSDLPESWRQE
ncbi:MAG: sulfotransferase [Pseudomonadota bacterium]